MEQVSRTEEALRWRPAFRIIAEAAKMYVFQKAHEFNPQKSITLDQDAAFIVYKQ